MKIVEIIHALNPGGAERLVVDLSNRLSQNKHNEVYVVILKNRESRNENFYAKELSGKIHFIPLGFADGVKLSYPLKVHKTLKSIKPDVVHIHCVLMYMLFSMLFYRKCKYIVTLHNKAEIGFPGIQKKLVAYFVKRRILQVVTISHTNQKSFWEYTGLNNDILVYNGREQPEKTNHYSQTEKFIAGMRTSAQTIILLVIAKCSVQKNLKLLINSVNNINEKFRLDIKLVIIGDGYHDKDLGKELLSLASDSILFLGPKLNVADYYYLCDAFCLSSLFEGMPISLIEAIACECITVSTPVSGVVDVIRDGETGFISPGFSGEEYEHTLMRFIQNRNKINKGAIKASFINNYSIDICAGAYQKIFES
jgi:Glycosyltransferase